MDIDELYLSVRRAYAHYATPGHGIDHVLRVARVAKYIALREGYDPLEAEIAGLLHDIGRTVQDKDEGHGPAGVPLAIKLLNKYTDFDTSVKQRISIAIQDHSALKAVGILTHIVQDADKLDGLGAIGIARAYMHRSDLPLYDVDELLPSQAAVDMTGQSHLLWLLEWVNMMETGTGRELAKIRGDFTQKFMHQIAREAVNNDILF